MKVVFSHLTENGMEEQDLQEDIADPELKAKEYVHELTEWDRHFKTEEVDEEYLKSTENKVCIKTTIISVSHPFETKTMMKTRCVNIPFNGRICTDVPQLFRRSVTYKVFAEVCYPVDLIITNVEKCAKQGAIAATAAAASGNFAAATVTFQAAFLACMVFSDVTDAAKISARVAGEKEHGNWIPV